MVLHTIVICQLKIIWNLIQEYSEDNYKFSSAEKRDLNPSEQGEGGGYSGFQVTGMIKGFFWFEIFDFGICVGRKILACVAAGPRTRLNRYRRLRASAAQARKFWQVFFWQLDLSRDWLGYSKQSEDS